MKSRDRASFPGSRSWRAVLLVVVIVVIAVFVVRRRHPVAIVSAEPVNAVSSLRTSVLRERSNTPKSKANETSSVEVCGYGAVQMEANDDGAILRQVGALTKGAGMRWLSALEDSGDLRARVAGLMLEGKLAGDDAPRPVTEQTRNEVVQLAAGADPAVYAMALSICDAPARADPDSACRQISNARWTQLDPDNAIPWLMLSRVARASHDSAAEANAWRHVGRALTVDSYGESLLVFAEPEMPSDVTPLERDYLASEVMGVEAALGAPWYGIANQHCSDQMMRDSTVRQQCDAFAGLLARKSTTLLDLSMSKHIGARAGWPGKRVAGIEQQLNAMMWSIKQLSPPDPDEAWTCDAVNRVNAYIVERVQLGELGAARQALEHSGETVTAAAQKYTQWLDNIRRDALQSKFQDVGESR